MCRQKFPPISSSLRPELPRDRDSRLASSFALEPAIFGAQPQLPQTQSQASNGPERKQRDQEKRREEKTSQDTGEKSGNGWFLSESAAIEISVLTYAIDFCIQHTVLQVITYIALYYTTD